MPKQKKNREGNAPIAFRPGTLQRDRLNQLIEHRSQNQSTVLNAAIDLLWLLDIGYDRISLIQQADTLKDECMRRERDGRG